MTPEQLAAIRARLDAATPGPWHWDEHTVPTLHGVGGSPDTYEYEAEVIEATHTGGCGCRAVCYLDLTIDRSDAEFIAAARTDLEVLLAEVDRLTQILAAVDAASQPKTWKSDSWSVDGRTLWRILHPPREPTPREPKPLDTGDWTPEQIWTEETP